MTDKTNEEFDGALEDLEDLLAARDEAQQAFEAVLTEQSRLQQHLRECDGLVHRIEKQDVSRLDNLRVVSDALREMEKTRERLNLLRTEEQRCRSDLCRKQEALNSAANKALRPLRERRQEQVRALIDQAYSLADVWRAELERFSELHNIKFDKSAQLHVLAHQRINWDRFGTPPHERHQEAAHG